MSRAAYMRPSSAATWVVCTGNIDMRAMFPDAPEEADTEVTDDGTACHWLANEVWNNRFHPEGSLAPNGRVLTDEMFEAVDMYHDVLRGWPEVVPVSEQTIPLDIIAPGMTGTPDAWAYNPTRKRLYIADLKFGFRFVEVWENWQLICYAWGLIELLGLNDQDIIVEFTIVQPRARHRDGPIRTWRVQASNLRAHLNILQHAAQAATQYTPNPGCGDCPGRHICVALQHSALIALERSYEGDPYELPPMALGDELRRLKEAEKRLSARITGLEMQTESLLRNGVTIPGWVLSATYARETWKDEQAIINLAKHYGANITKPVKAITPNQARKLLPPAVVDMFAHRPSTGVRLTKQDPYEAQKAFDQ